ncbi:MAG: hypothetical protein PVF80_14285, partial [Gammaproteobacteria bacterium]
SITLVVFGQYQNSTVFVLTKKHQKNRPERLRPTASFPERGKYYQSLPAIYPPARFSSRIKKNPAGISLFSMYIRIS